MRKQSVFNTELVKAKIEQSGYRTDYLAKQVGVSIPTFRAYLCGVRAPRPSVVKLLSQVLGIREEDFFVSGEAS